MSDYGLVFLAGVLGAIHCVGMCGGLIMACGVRCGGGFSFSLVYNTGRVLSYMVLGLVMGLLGKTLLEAGLPGRFQGALPIVAGVFMILIGLELLGYLPAGLKRFFTGLFPSSVSRALTGGGIKKKRPAAFVLGMLNGLIPCGLIYAVGVKAASTADPVKGMFIMASLGAGTFLPLLFTGSLTGVMGRLRAGLLTTVSSVLIIALGIKSVHHGFTLMQHAHMMMHM